jgi:hypothetical protein
MDATDSVRAGAAAFAKTIVHKLEHSVAAADAHAHATTVVNALLQNGDNARAKIVHMLRRVQVPGVLLALILRFPGEECTAMLAATTLLVAADTDVADDVLRQRGLSVVQLVLNRGLRPRLALLRPLAAALSLLRALLQHASDRVAAVKAATHLALHRMLMGLLLRRPEAPVWRDATVALAMMLCRPSFGGDDYVTAVWEIHPGTAVDVLNAHFVRAARNGICVLLPRRDDEALTALCHCAHAIAIADTRGFCDAEGFSIVVALLGYAETPRLLEAVFALLFSALKGAPVTVFCELARCNAAGMLLSVLARAPTLSMAAWLFAAHAYLLAMLSRKDEVGMALHTAPETPACLSGLRLLADVVRLSCLERAKAQYDSDAATTERILGDETVARVCATMTRIANFRTALLLLYTAEMSVIHTLLLYSTPEADEIVFRKNVMFRPLHVLGEVRDSPMSLCGAAQVLRMVLHRGSRSCHPRFSFKVRQLCDLALREPFFSSLTSASVSSFGLVGASREGAAARLAVRDILAELQAVRDRLTVDAVD